MVDAVIAGGQRAMLIPVEGAEDNRDLGKEDLEKLNFSQKDVLCGIAASGRTPMCWVRWSMPTALAQQSSV